MTVSNGGILGSYYNLSNTKVSGVYSLNDVYTNVLKKSWPDNSRDPYYNQVSLLIKSTDVVNSNNNVFLDSSTNNFAITRGGNVAQGAFSPFSAVDGRWSEYFDASGDYWQIASPPSSIREWWTTPYTIECWINAANFSTWSTGTAPNLNPTLVGNMTPTTTTNYWSFGPCSDGRLRFGYFTTAQQYHVVHPKIMKPGEWYHIAMTFDNSGAFQMIRLFVNGEMEYYTILGGSPVTAVATAFSIGSFNNTSINGFVSNLRILKGTCLYNESFIPPKKPLEIITNTSLLMLRNKFGTEEANSSLVITRGAANITATPFSPFNYPDSVDYSYTEGNSGSAYYDGTGDYLRAANSASFTIGTSDFTIEMWLNIESIASRVFFEMRTTTTQAVPTIYIDASGFLYYYVSGANRISYTTVAVPIKQWLHIAVSRVSSNTRMFLNGTQVGSTYADTTNYLQNQVDIGGSVFQNASYHLGYIGEVRFVIGTGLYSSNFTPPTEPFTAVANTRLLIKNSNSKIYDVTGKNIIETVGDARTNTTIVQKNTTSIGFDGSGDRLVLRTYNNSIVGLEDFTIELWTRLNTVTGSQVLYEGRPGANGVYPLLYMNAAVLTWYVSSAARITGTNLVIGTWYHIAVCRSNQITKMFVNGVQYGNLYTDTNSYVIPAYSMIGADFGGASVVNGVIEDFRLTKGVARYWSNFTPPERLVTR